MEQEIELAKTRRQLTVLRWLLCFATALGISVLPAAEYVLGPELAESTGLAISSAWAAGECGPPECSASVMNQVTAAFATMGYWAHGDMLYQLTETDFGLWAPLLYVMAVFSGLIMMAMGQPPRTYIWFLMGPAIYNWLLFTTVDRKGVAWKVARTAQDQQIVWGIAEVGLANMNQVIREGADVDKNNGIDKTTKVALVFSWFDDLISEQMDFLVAWAGIYNQRDGAPDRHVRPNNVDDKAWSIMSNSKWPMLENITGAALMNNDLREGFVRFFSSECADVMSKYIYKPHYIAAQHSRGTWFPRYVFGPTDGDIKVMINEMYNTIIPIPETVKSMITAPSGKSSLANFVPAAFDDTKDDKKPGRALRNIDCASYLWLVMTGFRWEAGHIYNQMVNEQAGYGITEEEVVYAFLYGWRVGVEGEPLDSPKQKQFVKDLILVHLLRNEMSMTPTLTDVRYASAEKTVNYSKTYQRNIGSKNKFGELYTWAKMMPYIQGILLYILSMAFPAVCVVIVIPGWHKALFTWMGFFAWAKSWDAGFAIVMSLERSIWAMVGNTHDAAKLNDAVYFLQKELHSLDVKCSEDGFADPAAAKAGGLGCQIPEVTSTKGEGLLDTIDLFDFAFTLGTAMDIDLANSYYIYVRSALYLAVPAVTGQVLLGAKAGASGMVSTAVGGVAQESGRNAAQGATSEVATAHHNAFATAGNEQLAKGFRSKNLAMGAIQAGNAGVSHNAASSALGTQSQILGQLSQAAGMRHEEFGAAAAGGSALHDYLKGFKKTQTSSATPGAAAAGATRAGGGTRGAASPAGNMPAGAGGGGRTAGNGMASMIGGALAEGWKRAYKAGLPVGAAYSLGSLDSTRKKNAYQMGNMISQAAFAADQYQHGAMAQGAGLAGQRLGAAAQHQAQTAQWRAMRNLSQQYAGRTGAMGVFAGAFSAGPPPSDRDGMASVGMLDTYSAGGGKTKDVSGAFWWIRDPNGYQAQVKNSANNLRHIGSPQAFANVYQVGSQTMTEGLNRGIGQLGTSLGSVNKWQGRGVRPSSTGVRPMGHQGTKPFWQHY